jgi:hypothetical protein
MAQRQKVLGIKIDAALEWDIQKACGGICSKSRLLKEAILKDLARRNCLSLEAANKTIGVDGYRTLNYVQTSKDDEKTGIITKYDETGSFITHILVPFNEGGRTFYRDQNGYKWADPEDDKEDEQNGYPGYYYPVFTEDGEAKEIG